MTSFTSTKIYKYYQSAVMKFIAEMSQLLSGSVFLSLDDLLSPLRLRLCLGLCLFLGLCLALRMAADDERYDHGGKFMNYATFESHLCGTFKSQLCVPQDNFEDLEDLLLPNSSYSISWDELELDSDGEIRLVGDFERSPVSPTLILNNNGALDSDDENRLVSDFDRNPVSPTLILNDYGGDGTAEENAREEVKGGIFPLELSKKVRESNHQSLDVQRQQWQNFPRVIPNFADSPSSGSKLDLDSDGEIWLVDTFERNPVSPTIILNNNGGDGTVQENTREEEVKERKFPLGISKKVCKSSHRDFGGRRQQWQNFSRIVPNFPDLPNSGSKLALDSDGEIWSLDEFERSPVSPTLILNNNCGYGTVEENSWEEKVSPTVILNNDGGDGTVQEKTREEVKGRKFALGISKKVCKSSHPNLVCRRQKWGHSRWVSPNSPVSPHSWSESMSNLGVEIRLSDDFDRNPVSTTFFQNDNGGNGTVEEKTPKSNHWSLACRRQQLSRARRCMHCQTETTPQWRAGPMGPKTLCNACGVRYKSGRLLPEYRPAASPTFDSLKHSNFHRKIARNLIGNQDDGFQEHSASFFNTLYKFE